MDRQSASVFVALVIVALNTGYYVWTIWKGRTQPPRSSYWIWTFLGVLLLGSYVAGGGKNWYVAALNTAGSGVVAVLSLQYGEGTALNKWDRRAVALALASLPLWICFRFLASSADAALLAFSVQMLADAAAGMPLIEKAWNRPQTEDRAAWVVGTVVYVVNACAVREWTVQDVVLNGWIGGVCLAVTLMLFFRPRTQTIVSQIP